MSMNVKRLDGKDVYLSILRTDEEAKNLYLTWISDEETAVNNYLHYRVMQPDEIDEWIHKKGVMRFGIVHKESDKLIGFCGIDHKTEGMCAYLSITIGDKEMRGKGYGREAINLMKKFCFDELCVQSVHLEVLDTNEQAIKCYKSAGFVETGVLRGYGFNKGKYLNWIHMDVQREEYVK